MTTSGFEVVDHTADWALRIYGRDLPDLLIQAALGMGSLLVADLDSVPLTVRRTVSLQAMDRESLLVGWLSELAYWAEEERLIFRQFELCDVSETRLQGTAYGGQAAELQKHIKAVTYHNLDIQQTETGLVTTIVFDV
ncbi:MAG: archease [Anaerolineae bacterium]